MTSNSYTEGRAHVWLKRLILATITLAPTIYFSLGELLQGALPGYSALSDFAAPVELVAATVDIVYLGSYFARSMHRGLQQRLFNVDSLITIGTLTAYVYSLLCYIIYIVYSHTLTISPTSGIELHFSTVVYLYFFVSLGRYLEARATSRATLSIRELTRMRPRRAKLINGGNTIIVPVERIRVGDHLRVDPNEVIPIDGHIISGVTTVNEAMITGESRTAEKSIGSPVISGAINGHGTIEIEADKVASESMLARIIRAISRSRASRTTVESIADRISSVFVPATIVAALVAFAGWYFFGGETLPSALMIFVTVIMVACPYALGLAMPSAITVGIGIGTKHGILISGGKSMQQLDSVDTVIFDKTGTLTYGELRVTDIITLNSDYDRRSVLTLAASLERPSEHALAKAILRESEHLKLKEYPVANFKALDKLGVVGTIDGASYYLGSEIFLEKYCMEALPDDNKKLARERATLVYLFTKEHIIAAINVVDPIKPGASKTIRALRKEGKEIYLISGDNVAIAETLARHLGIKNVIAGALPNDKANKVIELRQAGKVIAMVGDGVNDAPAIACADVGIAIGTGTEAAIESGDIVLVNGDPYGVIRSMRLAHATLAKAKQNLFFALFYNVISIPIAAGLLSWVGITLRPELAGLVMVMSSLAVIVNSLTLKLYNIDKPNEPVNWLAPGILFTLFTAIYALFIAGSSLL